MSIKGNVEAIRKLILEAVERGVESTVLDLAEDWQKNSQKAKSPTRSPIGASGELANSWDVNISSNNRKVSGEIKNTASKSFYRIVGRSPGGFPPPQTIKNWIQTKGLNVRQNEIDRVAFLIGRKIATKGTERYQSKNNFIGLNPDTGKLTQDARIRYIKILIDNLKKELL